MLKGNRRKFISGLPLLGTLPAFMNFNQKTVLGNLPISCNAYNWLTFYKREGKVWAENWDDCIAEFAKTGIKAFEPGLTTIEDAKLLIKALKKYNIAMPSVYVNSVLHKNEEAGKSITEILALADLVKAYGTKIIVTNPTPIKWGGPEIKTDAELSVQAKSLDQLGAKLAQKGLVLAYHTHEVELRAGAREFHHMLQNTKPENMSFCMDVHWVFRGSNDSQLAVFDVLKMYGKRIVELHLRQSIAGIWSETFGSGDIDYEKFANQLRKMNLKPHLVIEQCIEAASSNTITVIEAHKLDLKAVKGIFM
jgi:inosose dehydratase